MKLRRFVHTTAWSACVILLMTSCWDAANLEQMYFANAVGLDYTDGQYVMYTQIVNFHSMQGGGESTSRSDVQVFVGKSTGSTIGEAANRLYKQTQRKIHWGHLSAVVLSESVLKQDVLSAVETLSRLPVIRQTVWLFATRKSPHEVMMIPPIMDLGAIYSILTDPIDGYEQSSFIEPIRLHRFFTLLSDEDRPIFLPLLDTKDDLWQEDYGKSVSNIVFEGAAVLQGESFKKCFRFESIPGVRFMQDRTVRTTLQITEDGKPQAMMNLIRPSSSVEVDLSGGMPRYTVKITTSAVITELLAPLDDAQLKHKISQTVEQEIRSTYLRGLEVDADMLQLVHHLHHHYVREWQKMKKDGELGLTPDSLQAVEVEIEFIQSGEDKLFQLQQ